MGPSLVIHSLLARRRRGRASTLAVAALVVTLGLPASAHALVASHSSRSSGAPPASIAGAGAYVRVNQVGYAIRGSKRAYLMSSARETAATFVVEDEGGRVVYSASLGARLGSWSKRYPFVYALDFDHVAVPGNYVISVSGPVSATSPSFRIDRGAVLYTQPLANALSFYQAERDGPGYIPSALRTAPAHLNDTSAMTYRTPKVNADGGFKGDLKPLGVRIDASGGWWDAGDYPKFVETTNYTVDLLLAGVRDFPRQMGLQARHSNFTQEARFGVDWLLRMWDDRTRTLYYQVGIASGNNQTIADHDIWRLPQADDTYGGTNPLYRYIRNRPVFRAGPPGARVSPNLAGRDAAAFALCFQVFRWSDRPLAARCLLAAEHIFALANTSPTGDLLTIIPFDFYGETEWRDDMELGATELSLALAGGRLPAGLPHTDPAYYLRKAAHWAKAYMTGPGDAGDTLNLYDVSGLAHYELYRAIGWSRHPVGLAVTRAQLLADMKKELDNAVMQGGTDPFGFGYTWSNWDTTTHGAGLAVMASEFDQLTRSHTYADYGRRWLGNILGANAWGTSLIVGDGSVFPHCMQHQVTNIVGSLDGSAPILAGAAVEGPNSFAARGRLPHMRACPPDGVNTFAQFNGSGAVYRDDVQSYSTVEPAIDLTASSPLAFSREALGLF